MVHEHCGNDLRTVCCSIVAPVALHVVTNQLIWRKNLTTTEKFKQKHVEPRFFPLPAFLLGDHILQTLVQGK